MVLSRKTIIGLTMATLMSTTALAQESTTDGNSSTVTYNEIYFTEFKPITLHDMLRSVPGTAALLAQADDEVAGRRVRGFGSSGDQILFDGKRIAGKANSLGLQLRRIQATSVSHIELIRGTKAGLDVQSEGLIVNVVLKESTSKSTTTWTVGSEYASGGQLNPLAKVNHSGELNKLKYSLGVDFALEETRQEFEDTFFFASRAQYQDNSLTSVRDRQKIFFNGGIEYNAANGDILRLNGQLELDDQETVEIDNRLNLLDNSERVVGNDFDFSAGDAFVLDRLFDHDPLHWEIGGDYQHRFDKAGLLKVLFVVNDGVHDFDFTFRSALNDASLGNLAGNLREFDHSEKIIRTSLTNTFAEVHTLEIGGEAAINKNRVANLPRALNGSGNLVDVTTAQSDTGIKEVRFEGFASHNWSIASNISLQSSLNAEYSEIKQNNNINTAIPEFSRDFFYLKPRMNLRYDVDTQNQIRATVERKISQLDFMDFGDSFDAEDGEVDGGNGQLRPEDRWEFSLAYENRFADDQGSLSIKGFYNTIRDHIAKLPGNDINMVRTDDPTLAVTSIPGNIGNAKEYGVEVNGNLRLKALNLPNAIITAKYVFRETETTDPFLMVERPIEYIQKHEWLVNFQHDLTKTGTSYGFSVTNKGPQSPGGGTIGFRTDVREQWEQTIDPKASAYIEQKVFGDMKLRFDVRNIFKAKSGYDRLRYVGNISLNNVAFNEQREASQARVFKLSLQGSF